MSAPYSRKMISKEGTSDRIDVEVKDGVYLDCKVYI
jgi:hypothetical protein